MIKINQQLKVKTKKLIESHLSDPNDVCYSNIKEFENFMFNNFQESQDWRAYLSAAHDLRQKALLDKLTLTGVEEINADFTAGVLKLYYDSVLNFKHYI